MILMLGSEGQVVTGKAALKQQFGMYLEKVYRGFQSLEKIGFYEDSICLEATINTTEGVVRVWDALYMKDDKIYRHFSGVMQ
ncbi:hypothetical protein [Chlorobium sp. KB01]|uniref:hypothetical protein n=1 Tax=Chlorobium sp. KB01 TaxID=1917528 RepID=UPI0009764994|nr:hypothetical protein [Chlorobium sp. KB01]